MEWNAALEQLMLWKPSSLLALPDSRLLVVGVLVLAVRWYRSLHEGVRLSHKEAGIHPVIQKWKSSSETLREGYRPTASLSMFGPKFLVGSLHTIIHNVIRTVSAVPEVVYERELFTLRCGATVGMDWAAKVGDVNSVEPHTKEAASKPIVLLHHGLAGCSKSHYIQSMVGHLVQKDAFRVVVMVARGCGGVPLTTPYGFTAAGYNDLRQVAEHLRAENPDVRMYGIGYSLGAGLLSNYLGRSGKDCVLNGAVVVSPCWDYTQVTPYFDLWSKHFITASNQENYAINENVLKTHKHVSYDAAIAATSQREFDEAAIVPVHGFQSADDYYVKSSALPFSHEVHCPTLSLSAEDDPVCSVEGAASIVEAGTFGPGLLVARTQRGGHVCWAEGAMGHDSWMDRIILEWIDTCHEHEDDDVDDKAQDNVNEETDAAKPIHA